MPTTKVLDPDGDVCLQLRDYRPYYPNTRLEWVSDWEELEDADTVEESTAHESPANEEVSGEESSEEGTDEEDLTDSELHLIVSSKVLSLASPVFKAMFFGNFKEGLELARNKAIGSSEPYPVELPDDYANAALVVCSILYSKTKQIPERLHLCYMEELGIFVDKYQCGHVLKHAAQIWMNGTEMLAGWINDMRDFDPNRFSGEVGLHHLVEGIVLAYLVDLPYEYTMIASLLVKHDEGPETQLDDLFTYRPEHT